MKDLLITNLYYLNSIFLTLNIFLTKISSPIAGSLPTDNSASKRQVQAFEERNKNVLSLKTSPDGLSKRLLPEISPQKSVRGPAPKTQAFVVEEAANEGERAASK